jgi:heterodisulfide reductase subunit B
MNYALFLGCITPNRYPGIEVATRKVLPQFKINLEDMHGASCCPAPGVFRSFSMDAWLVAAARNLCIAEEMGLNILTLCNGCYGTLWEANHELKTHDSKRKMVNSILSKIGKEFRGNIEVKHFVEVLLKEIGSKEIRKMISKPLKLKVAAHYGCHLLKPKVYRKLDSVERPRILDDLIVATGAESLDYSEKMACCGAGGGVRSGVIDVSLRMLNDKLSSMREANADCIVNVCPFCHLQFDRGQIELKEMYNISIYNLPTLHYFQLLGLAMGMKPKEVGTDLHYISFDKAYEKIA